MISGRALLTRLAPLLACFGLLAVWQAASLALNNESFPTALDAIRAIPSILGDKDALINILASLRRMVIGFCFAVTVSIPLGLMMGRSRAVASFFNPLLMAISQQLAMLTSFRLSALSIACFAVNERSGSSQKNQSTA